MTRGRWTSLRIVAAAGLLLSACVKVDTITPDIQAGMLRDLSAGKLNLDCGAACLLRWRNDASQIHALDLAEKWTDLATRVMQIGYGEDLSYYYLGQAAQGLGYHQAAITYYNYAFGLTTGQNAFAKCASSRAAGVDTCQGVDLAGSIPVLVQASRDAIAQQEAAATPPPPPPPHHHRHVTPKPQSAPASTATGSGTADVPLPPPPTVPTQ